MTDRELLQEIEAWLCFNKSPDKENIKDLHTSIKEHLNHEDAHRSTEWTNGTITIRWDKDIVVISDGVDIGCLQGGDFESFLTALMRVS